MTEPIDNFVGKFGTRIALDESLLLRKQNKLYLLDKNLRRLVAKDFFYAGTYLGKLADGEFFPSFNLLRMIAEKDSNRVIIQPKTEWLFICGRDVFREGIIQIQGSRQEGDYTLILNNRLACLGFGRILHDLSSEKEGVVIKNILDLGDFLRREKTVSNAKTTVHKAKSSSIEQKKNNTADITPP